jgi:hypothetical protein
MNFGNESVERLHHDGGSGGSLLQFLCSREGWTRARIAGRECGGDICTLLSEERGARHSHDAELVGIGKVVARVCVQSGREQLEVGGDIDV